MAANNYYMSGDTRNRFICNGAALFFLLLLGQYWDGLYAPWWSRIFLWIFGWNTLWAGCKWLGPAFLSSSYERQKEKERIADMLDLKNNGPRTPIRAPPKESRTPIQTPTLSGPQDLVQPQSMNSSHAAVCRPPSSPYRPVSFLTALASSPRSVPRDEPSRSLSIQHWTLERAFNEFNISPLELVPIISNLKKWIVFKLLKPFLLQVSQSEAALSSHSDLYSSLSITSGNILIAQQSSWSQIVQSRLGQDWLNNRLLLEEHLITKDGQSLNPTTSNLVCRWILERVTDLGRFPNMPTFELEQNPTHASPDGNLTLPTDSEILMNFFSRFLDLHLPKEASFRQCIYIDHSWMKDGASIEPLFSPSFLWFYPVIFRRISVKYQIITNTKIVFIGEEPTNAKTHWLYMLWFFVSFLQREYSEYLG